MFLHAVHLYVHVIAQYTCMHVYSTCNIVMFLLSVDIGIVMQVHLDAIKKVGCRQFLVATFI